MAVGGWLEQLHPSGGTYPLRHQYNHGLKKSGMSGSCNLGSGQYQAIQWLNGTDKVISLMFNLEFQPVYAASWPHYLTEPCLQICQNMSLVVQRYVR